MIRSAAHLCKRGETGDAVAPATGGGARRCRAAQCTGRRTSEGGRTDGRWTRRKGQRELAPLHAVGEQGEGAAAEGRERGKIREPYYVTDCEID